MCVAVEVDTDLGKNRNNEEIDKKGAKQCNGCLDAHIAQRALLLLHFMMGNRPAVHMLTLHS